MCARPPIAQTDPLHQLITSGRYMKTAKHNPQESTKMQFQLKRAVAAGSERFHDSLDELENEIRMAQAVLRRDLAQLRAERKQKEAQAKEKEAEKARQTAVVPIKENAAPPPAAKSPTPPPVKVEPPPPTSAITSASTAPANVEPEAPQPSDAKPPTPTADVVMENADALNTTQESEFDFDAMFGDGAMDTSGDGVNDTGDLDLDGGADLDFTLDDAPDQPDLLRGLEDFAKGGADESSAQPNASNTLDLDFAMADMSDLNTNPPVEQPVATKAEDAPTQQPAATAPAEELNLDTMATDNLDDLFDLDHYENPEATQFDDAFFGFGDN